MNQLNRKGGGLLAARTVALVTLLGIFVVFGSTAYGVVVQTTNRIINNGPTDFGSGTHSFGGPSGNATITFDWNNTSGQIVSTGRVRGTLYWDSLFSGGCARLTIRFLNSGGTALATRVIDECGPGGDANNAGNKTAVDQSFASADLFNISLRVAEIGNGGEVNPQSVTITQVTTKSFPVTIDNGTADFGDGNHHFGRPDNPGFVSFRRNATGSVTGSVDGILFWDSLSSSGCASMSVNFRSVLGGNHVVPFTECGPGGDANNGANELFISEVFTNGLLFTIRLTVSTPGSTTPAAVQEFGFAGLVGDFDVEPATTTVGVKERVNYAFNWTVPEPLNWHDLATLEFRIMDGSDPILHIRFNESTGQFAVLNEANGQFGKDFAAGSNARLQTRFATLFLADASAGPVNNALGIGPNSPTVRLVLPIQFKPSAAGKTYLVEVAAIDDTGNREPFALAGTITVSK
jgi:hypothetical protein